MKASYEIGDKIKMTNVAIENYGNKYAGRVFTVSHIARNRQEHPGFDECAGSALYDFEELNFSLYEWEMRRA